MTPIDGRPPADPDDFEIIDVQRLIDRATFVLHAVRRRKLLFALVALATLGLVAAAWVLAPRSWRIEATLLAQRNTVMPALGNPTRTVPLEADNPTRAAAETVLRRDNLVSLLKQTDLLRRWRESRPWLGRVKDRVVGWLAPPTDEERAMAMIGYLEKQLSVQTTESTVNIRIDWPEAQLGYRLVDTALQNFLEQRHTAEISTIAETISILEGHAKNLREGIDASMDELVKSRETSRGQALAAAPSVRRDPAQDTLRTEASEVKVRLDAKRRAIDDLEEFRRRRLAELQAELAQQRAVYADAHPAVAKVLQSIAALQEDSPQLAALRKDERDLQAEYEKLGGRVQAAGSTRSASYDTSAIRRRAAEKSDDVGAEYARTRLRFALEKYDALLERIDSARIELDTARAAFKYRYSVVRPPIIPRRPEKPKASTFLLGGLFAALVAATAAATWADVRSGRVLERWQIERTLGLPILGSLPRV